MRPNAYVLKLAATAFAGAVLAVYACCWCGVKPSGGSSKPASLPELLALLPSRLSEVPIAHMNLLCAQDLAPTSACCTNCLARLETWAARVQTETARHLYRFQRNPGEFENSEGLFRMLLVAVVLAEDFGVHYDTQRTAGPERTRPDDGFFADPESLFLHGLLGPQRKGTCSSMPVLYVAIGRRLGYPLYLVTTKGHLFVRWDGSGERFNIEATSCGLNRFDDDYYRHWPFEVSPREEQAEGYLKSLTPAQELAVFLSIRGMCLRESGRITEAAEAFGAAVRLDPDCRGYRLMLAALQARSGTTRRPNSPLVAATPRP